MGELGGAAVTVTDGCRLQAVELVENIVVGEVGDEVVDVVRGGCVGCGLVELEGGGACERVVYTADEIGVGQGFAAELSLLLADFS